MLQNCNIFRLSFRLLVRVARWVEPNVYSLPQKSLCFKKKGLCFKLLLEYAQKFAECTQNFASDKKRRFAFIINKKLSIIIRSNRILKLFLIFNFNNN